MRKKQLGRDGEEDKVCVNELATAPHPHVMSLGRSYRNTVPGCNIMLGLLRDGEQVHLLSRLSPVLCCSQLTLWHVHPLPHTHTCWDCITWPLRKPGPMPCAMAYHPTPEVVRAEDGHLPAGLGQSRTSCRGLGSQGGYRSPRRV